MCTRQGGRYTQDEGKANTMMVRTTVTTQAPPQDIHMPFDQATYQIPDCQDILSETHNLLLHPHPCQKMTRTSCVGFFSVILEKPFPVK